MKKCRKRDDESGWPTYLHTDLLGSVMLETNTAGNVVNDQRYYAYGRRFDTGGDISGERDFTGQKLDATGLVYMNARYYDPQLGMFLSPDTIVPEPTQFIDYNRYLYTRGNPLKYNDPSGHCAAGENGQPDEDDQKCWQYAYTIWAQWDNTDYWQKMWPEGKDHFIKNIATQPIKADYFKGEFMKYVTSDEYKAWTDAHSPTETIVNTFQDKVYDLRPCDFWDCQALGYDVAGIGGNLLTSASLAGELPSGGLTTAGVVAGVLINQTATVAGLAHTMEGYSTQQSSAADVIVISATSVVNPFPVLGTISGVAQLAWDFFDPFIPIW